MTAYFPGKDSFAVVVFGVVCVAAFRGADFRVAEFCGVASVDGASSTVDRHRHTPVVWHWHSCAASVV